MSVTRNIYIYTDMFAISYLAFLYDFYILKNNLVYTYIFDL